MHKYKEQMKSITCIYFSYLSFIILGTALTEFMIKLDRFYIKNKSSKKINFLHFFFLFHFICGSICFIYNYGNITPSSFHSPHIRVIQLNYKQIETLHAILYSQ